MRRTVAWPAPGPGFGGPGFEDIDFRQFFGERFGGGPGGGPAAAWISATSSPNSAARVPAPAARGGGGGSGAETTWRTVNDSFCHGGHRRPGRHGVDPPGGKVETLGVKIPAGIEDGKKIRLRRTRGARAATAARPATSS